MKEELCMEIDPPFKENLATVEDWRKALNKVVLPWSCFESRLVELLILNLSVPGTSPGLLLTSSVWATEQRRGGRYDSDTEQKDDTEALLKMLGIDADAEADCERKGFGISSGQ
ncbi:hypothetical protein F0562_023943 [Nyssa sinensis]|uniref:Uncharacterized protein n=1 Tax=Nyssa sinensis TaxID=561372 RepID=A0A5J5BNQ4_9ASTE|nr:hypothetical protein F0562_023943 [Nyssa sinensis]